MLKNRIVKLLGGVPAVDAVKLYREKLEAERAHAADVRAAGTAHAAIARDLDTTRADLAAAESRLQAERIAGGEILIAAARAIGNAAVANAGGVERLQRIAREDGLAAVAAELAEFPIAPTTGGVS